MLIFHPDRLLSLALIFFSCAPSPLALANQCDSGTIASGKCRIFHYGDSPEPGLGCDVPREAPREKYCVISNGFTEAVVNNVRIQPSCVGVGNDCRFGKQAGDDCRCSTSGGSRYGSHTTYSCTAEKECEEVK